MLPNEKKQLIALAGTLAVLAGLYWASRPSQEGPGNARAGADGYADVPLAKFGGGDPETLRSCPTERCVNVYVAPWCGVCRATTDMILALRPWLAARGATVRVIVGRDRPDAVEDYARTFGNGTLMDPAGTLSLLRGVPEFAVTDSAGRILNRFPGLPRLYRPPITEADLESFAEFLGVLRAVR